MIFFAEKNLDYFSGPINNDAIGKKDSANRAGQENRHATSLHLGCALCKQS